MSALANPKDMRKHERFKYQGPAPGKLIAASDGREIRYRVKDFSTKGLGILTKDPVLPDVDFLLLVQGSAQPINLAVVWGMDFNDGQGSHRYGFQVCDEQTSLEEVFTSLGLG